MTEQLTKNFEGWVVRTKNGFVIRDLQNEHENFNMFGEWAHFTDGSVAYSVTVNPSSNDLYKFEILKEEK